MCALPPKADKAGAVQTIERSEGVWVAVIRRAASTTCFWCDLYTFIRAKGGKVKGNACESVTFSAGARSQLLSRTAASLASLAAGLVQIAPACAPSDAYSRPPKLSH